MTYSYGLEKLQHIAGKLMACLLFLLPMVFLFAPVQSSSLFLLLSLTSIPFFRWSEKNGRLVISVLVMLTVFLGWGALTGIWSEHNQLVEKRIIRFAIGLPFALMFFNTDLKKLHENVPVELSLISGFSIAAVIIAIDAVFGAPVSNYLYLLKGDDFVANMLKPGVSMVSLVGFLLLAYRMKDRDRVFYLLVGLFLFCALHPAQMLAIRVGLIPAILSFAYCVLYPRGLAWLLAMGVITICLALPFMLTAQNLSFLVDAGAALPNSMMHRLVIWEHARELFFDNSLMGYGLGSSRFLAMDEFAGIQDLPEIYRSYQPWIYYVTRNDVPLLPLHPHSLGLQVLLETGVIGALLLMLLSLTVVTAISRSFSSAQMRRAFPVFILLLIAMSFSYSIWQSWWLAVQFLMFGMMRILLADKSDRQSG